MSKLSFQSRRDVIVANDSFRYVIIVAAFYIRPDPAEKVFNLGFELGNIERSKVFELH